MAYANGREKHARGRAFALAEALVVALVVGLLVAVLLVSGERARRTAMIGEDLSNLRQIGQLTGQYANDFEDKIWSFSWKKGTTPSAWPDLKSAFDDIEAASNQAIDIIRRLANRDEAGMPKVQNWFPHVYYAHLALMDYARLRPATLGSTDSPNRLFVGSGDKNRLLWISDVEGFENNKFVPNQPTVQTYGSKRWPYSSSYCFPHHFFSPSFGTLAISQGAVWNQYVFTGGNPLGAKSISDIAFPSEKVFYHESHGRHYGNQQPYFSVASGEARVPLLTVDGAADCRATKDGNKGWQPTKPTSANPTMYSYVPNAWDPPAVTGPQDSCFGSYTYTRSAEKGRDFGGPEVQHQP